MVATVLGAGATHRAFPQRPEQPSIKCGRHDSNCRLQTIIGLLGLWVAGTEVKSIVKGSTLKRSLSAFWSMFIHGEVPGHETVGTDPIDEQPPLKGA